MTGTEVTLVGVALVTPNELLLLPLLELLLLLLAAAVLVALKEVEEVEEVLVDDDRWNGSYAEDSR